MDSGTRLRINNKKTKFINSYKGQEIVEGHDLVKIIVILKKETIIITIRNMFRL